MGTRNRMIKPEWSELRLKDRIRPGVHVLFVGINPGVALQITAKVSRIPGLTVNARVAGGRHPVRMAGVTVGDDDGP